MAIEIKHRYTGAVLYAADVPADMPSAVQTRTAIEKATAEGANLAGAYLAGANLAGAYLAGAYLTGAYLAGANLAGANLAGAYLAGANLAGANLAGANLAGANLADAYLTGAKWREGVLIDKVPIQIYGLRWIVVILDAHMQIGCELHSLAQWSKYDDTRIAQMDRQALRFWREHKDPLLSMARRAKRSFAVVTETAVDTGAAS